MVRKIIQIDQEKCNGCGACAAACHEGAIGMANGKAQLLRDDYCDGLGDCLPKCPAGAISFVEREAAAYNEQAVLEHKQAAASNSPSPGQASQLAQWPCQIKLAPANAPYFQNASLLVAADCTAYAYANVHQEFMRGKTTIIGCPKLDAIDYSGKLEQIFAGNGITDITVLRMEVPCCGGLERAVSVALQNSGKSIPCQVVTVSTDGRILGKRDQLL